MKTFLKWLKRVLLGILILLLLSLTILYVNFYFDLKDIVKALPGNSQVAETSVGPVEYLIQGNTDKYCLLVHGTPGSYHTFNIGSLIEKGYTVISPSRPGYFRTPLNSGKTVEDQAAAFAALLDAINVESVVAIGFSGGVPSVVQFGLDYPEKCNELILIAGAAEQIALPTRGLMQKMMSTEFGSWLLFKLMPMQFEDEGLAQSASEYLRSAMLPKSEIIEGRDNDQYIFRHYPELQLEQMKCPTLIIHGTEDPIVPFAQAEIFAERIPNAKLLPWEGADHFKVVFFEFDKAMLQAIDFVNKAESAKSALPIPVEPEGMDSED